MARYYSVDNGNTDHEKRGKNRNNGRKWEAKAKAKKNCAPKIKMCRVCVCLLFFRLCQFEKCFVSIRTKNKLCCFLFPCLALHTHTHTHSQRTNIAFFFVWDFFVQPLKKFPFGAQFKHKRDPFEQRWPGFSMAHASWFKVLFSSFSMVLLCFGHRSGVNHLYSFFPEKTIQAFVQADKTRRLRCE